MQFSEFHLAEIDEEIWRPVRGWEGRYEVSDYGRVRNVKTGYRLRVCQHKDTNRAIITLSHPKKKSKTFGVARLVYETFVLNHERTLDKHEYVAHLDGDPTWNRPDNLILYDMSPPFSPPDTRKMWAFFEEAAHKGIPYKELAAQLDLDSTFMLTCLGRAAWDRFCDEKGHRRPKWRYREYQVEKLRKIRGL